jgi:acyl dehydratase
MNYFEEFEVGDSHELGSHTIMKDEIIEFAEQYDPQPFHIDEEAAKESMYEGLIASGWHTGSLCMRQVAKGLLNDTASMGGRGVDDFRWYKPVRPNDTLIVRGEVIETAVSEGNPERGYVDYKCTMTNQDDEKVMSMVGLLMIERRNIE